MRAQTEAMKGSETAIPPRYSEIAEAEHLRRSEDSARYLSHGAPSAPLFICAAATIIGGAILFLFDPAHHSFYPICTFYSSTGLLCPGCGSLRALHQLLHGHIAAALHFNALLVLSLPFASWLAGRLTIAKLRNHPSNIVIRPAWLWCGLVVLLVFGIIRNLPFALH